MSEDEIVGWFDGKPVTRKEAKERNLFNHPYFLADDNYEPRLDNWKCSYCGQYNEKEKFNCITCGAKKK